MFSYNALVFSVLHRFASPAFASSPLFPSVSLPLPNLSLPLDPRLNLSLRLDFSLPSSPQLWSAIYRALFAEIMLGDSFFFFFSFFPSSSSFTSSSSHSPVLTSPFSHFPLLPFGPLTFSSFNFLVHLFLHPLLIYHVHY